MNRIKCLAVFLAIVFCLGTAEAQQEDKASIILDSTIQKYKSDNGIRILFDGSQKGTLLLKDYKFRLDCGGVISWFDGKTQWSYMEQSQEVNVTSPTPEEIQTVNPFLLITDYDKLFKCGYTGMKMFKGKQVHEVVMTPRSTLQGVKKINFMVSKMYVPVAITVEDENGNVQLIRIVEYKGKENFDDNEFRFDSDEYPDAEIIDMR